ncbi:WD40/YVTN/BNR-like repeat-containing protein [Portibacter marinus]|uniref:WD40/YVTN/BNR-like repeat-containing protein n=1 Tax=Portibacter marinus TaxID=2898660 RepID=UPI001F1BCCC7|nr:glycosyl hydrolase [Portibacter marinus]
MKYCIALIAIVLASFSINGQSSKKKTNQSKDQKSELPKFNDLKWRNIGPFRGGRSVTSSGVVGQPMTYYMGSTGGGIWKTEDDGITWMNVSDGFLKTGTVGAIAVSESNPNIVIAGMGEHAARGVMTSMGDGVYKSTDAGKTWNHIGLDASRHISDVIIHPNNPDIVFVTVQGAQYGPTEERGVYKSVDGGQNWKKVLYVNDITGASSLSMDMNNPLILYAAMWQHERKPWTMQSGGKDSGLYKSTDGGETWKRMDKGLPVMMGKAGISVSRANSDRVFAVLEAAKDSSGVYRSDDAGKTWKQVNKDRINVTRSWYYMEIFADPQDENWVYVLNAPAMKSIDGGRTFSRMSTPHGDNHHLWINPHDHMKMINSNDGGANVSNNGGKSWSTQQNQPTSQFYRVITDNLVPYNVYGGQQDNSAISIKSRTNDGGIDWKDWHSVAGCESAYLAFDPDNPELVYGGCYQGIIGKYVTSIMVEKEIKEYPELSLGQAPIDFKYRFNWNAPIISSPHDRSVIYHAGNVVFKTEDEGQSWKRVSPDLTRNNKDQQGPGGGPFTNEAAGGENYNTIMYLVESPHQEGVLWAGSDDGLVHITIDGGDNWTNVTPKNMPEGIVNSIEVSPHDPETAYIVLMRYKMMDLNSYIYKTEDNGKNWTKIVNGLDDAHGFARVVREDRNQEGLLYAGTETGMYISTDDGQNWHKWQLNLPIVPINDLTIQNNDLVVATAGRSFWILDDVAPLQSHAIDTTQIALIKPQDTYRLFGGSSSEPQPGLGQNPPQGVMIDYFLPENMDSSELTLNIYWADSLIRTISNQKMKGFKSWQGGPSAPETIPSKKGFNRFVWDFRTSPISSVEDVFVYGSYDGYRVVPGDYKLELVKGDTKEEAMVKVLPNPNIEASSKDFITQRNILQTIDQTIRDIHNSVTKIRSAKSQILTYKKLLKENEEAKELLVQGDTILAHIENWEEQLIQPDQKTFQDVINYNNKLNAEFMNLKSYIDSPMPALTDGATLRFADLMKEFDELEEERKQITEVEMQKYNDMYKSLNLPAIILD